MSVITALNAKPKNIVSQHLLEQMELEEIGRANRFKVAWDRYYGRWPKPLTVRRGQADDNVAANFARVIVNKGVSFLFGQDVSFELSETEETGVEEWLDQCWMANHKQITLKKLATNGAVCGHTFIKIIPQQPFPRLVVLDPGTVSVRWEPDDIETVMLYCISYPAYDPKAEKMMDYRQTIAREGQAWRVTDEISDPDSAVWRVVGVALWPHPWPPIIDCQNLPAPNEYWGTPDLGDDLLGLNESINFVLSNLNRIIRYHAHPKTWGRGFHSNQMQIAVDETIVLPSAEAMLQNLEMQSDLSSSVTLYEKLREALHEISQIPEIATGKVEGIGALSGVALAILYQPLLEKTEDKRGSYGEMLVELNRRLLALGGFGEENRTVLHWPELLPSDPLQERQALLLDQQLGASQDTLLTKAGYDPDLERQKRELRSAELGEQILTNFERGAPNA